MTIPSNTIKSGPYNGNDVTTSFAYNYKIFAAADLRVVHTDSSEVETDLVLDTDYSVSGVGDASGSITYPISGSPLPTGEKITILSSITYEQQTDLSNQGGFFPEVHETVFDKLCRQIQQLKEVTDRAVTSDMSSSIDPSDLVSQIVTMHSDVLSTVNNLPWVAVSSGTNSDVGQIKLDTSTYKKFRLNIYSTTGFSTRPIFQFGNYPLTVHSSSYYDYTRRETSAGSAASEVAVSASSQIYLSPSSPGTPDFFRASIDIDVDAGGDKAHVNGDINIEDGGAGVFMKVYGFVDVSANIIDMVSISGINGLTWDLFGIKS